MTGNRRCPEIEKIVDDFCEELDYGRKTKMGSASSYELAKRTVGVLKQLVVVSEWKTANELMDIVKSEGRIMSDVAEADTTVGNLVRRVLKLIREEYISGCKGRVAIEEVDVESLHNIAMVNRVDEFSDFRKNVPDLRNRIIESVDELSMELETSADEISNQSLEHIHTKEVILTIGKSSTVEKFLKQAAKSRKFQVIVAECAPFYHGQELAASLAKAKISTTVITDSAIFGMMARVNKVIIGTQSVMANGGLKAVTGSYTVALAAKHYSVPLIVLTPMYKLTPVYYITGGGEQDAMNRFVSPQETLKGLEGEILSHVRSVNPIFEYVPPELVTLFISNVSGHAPSYVYRLLSEYYHPDDYDL